MTSRVAPRRSDQYLMAAHAGAAILVAAIAAAAAGAPDFWRGVPMGMLLAIVVVLFVRGWRDEYVERLWNAGTAAAFLTALVATLGIEIARGFADPAVEPFAADALLAPLEVGTLILAAFFIAFHAAMWRGRR